MSLVTVIGSPSTTTAIALTAAWPPGERAVAVELDPTGGCAAAWLGVPTDPGLTAIVAQAGSLSWQTIQAATQLTTSGVELIAAPIHSGPASAAVSAASATMLPIMSAAQDVTFVVDAGQAAASIPAAAMQAGFVVVVHRQNAASAPAAAVGLERLAALCASLESRAMPHAVLMLGRRPYGVDELAEFVGTDSVHELPDDPYSAAVFAGRSGRQRRLLRAPLWSAMSRLGAEVSTRLRTERDPIERFHASTESGAFIDVDITGQSYNDRDGIDG